MPVITIARQFGSFGDEIGREVAERLSLRLVDQAVLQEVAQRLGVAAAPAEREERSSTLVTDLVRTMQRLYPATVMPPSDETDLDESASLQIVRQVIWEVARTDDAVIVGRGAAFILPRHPGILHVLTVAPFEVRVERVMAGENIDRGRAISRIKSVDGNRGRHVRHFYGTNWLDIGHYDLILDTAHFTHIHAASLICIAATPEDAGEQ